MTQALWPVLACPRAMPDLRAAQRDSRFAGIAAQMVLR